MSRKGNLAHNSRTKEAGPRFRCSQTQQTVGRVAHSFAYSANEWDINKAAQVFRKLSYFRRRFNLRLAG
jgi:hypothetical protein